MLLILGYVIKTMFKAIFNNNLKCEIFTNNSTTVVATTDVNYFFPLILGDWQTPL
jgi:hypothetical protein